ncbi:hypothetical protein [Vibrio quintilis]|uniref:Uncharacterized protein n=1 Tax=Vibrio quintilis TaxID=1117707 RepID=A0A1M7YZ00_9VIBR|nr:hypothetical protein [Vibrio quintilis]SHO57878.1 hypothetical protein VQ7734_03648 [Vibrio quintilis]
MNKPNFEAKIHFTVGLRHSAAITNIAERWLYSTEYCDAFENDLIAEGASAVLECVGINLDNEGAFVVDVLGVAKHEESPDYEIVKIESVKN